MRTKCVLGIGLVLIVAGTLSQNAQAQNDAPVPSADSYTVMQGATLSESAPGVLGNDSDPNGDSLTVSAVVAAPDSGSLSLDTDGSFSYTPDSTFTGIDEFSYAVSDGDTSAQASVEITVDQDTLGGGSNGAPVADSDSYTTSSGQTLTISAPGVLNNDSDPDDDSLSASVVALPDSGSLSLNTDGSFDYAPDSSFSGTDSFTYAASDGSASDSASVTISVDSDSSSDGSNSAPVANSDSFSTPKGQTLTVTAPGVLDNDSDPEGDSLTASVDSLPGSGTLSLNTNGSFTYSPDSSFSGVDDFSYEVSDGRGGTDRAIVEVTVEEDTSSGGTSGAPVAESDRYTTAPGQTLSIASPGVLINDSDPNGDSLTVSLVSGVSNGSLSLNGNGSFIYTPDSSFTGVDDFTYAVSDGDSSDEAIAEIVVEEDTTESGTSTPPSPTDLTASASPDSVTLSWSPPDTTVVASYTVYRDTGATASDSASALTTVPAPDTTYTDSMVTSGTTYHYRVSATDSTGTESSLSAEASATVSTSLTAAPDTFTTTAGQTLTVSAPGVLDNDSGASTDSLSVSLVTDVSSGSLTLNADGTFTYTPNTGFTGTDAFTYAVSDSAGATAEATVSLLVEEEETVIPTDLTATAGEEQIQLSWTAPTQDSVDGYYLYRDTSAFDSTSVPADVAPYDSTASGTTTVTDTSVTPGTTYHYRVTALGDTAETGFSNEVRAVPEGLVASESKSVSNTESEQDFEESGAKLNFSNVEEPGNVTVSTYSGEPKESESIDQDNVSDTRMVIDADASLKFTEVDVRLAVSRFRGIEDPNNVTVYKRGTPGSGTFRSLDTRVDDNDTPNDISDDTLEATTDGFSEFALGSDTEPLPVEMASFDARMDDGAVLLSWTTASENGNAGFRVQRRIGTAGGGDDPDVQASRQDASAWTTVGSVEGSGTTSQAQAYRFTDGELPYEADALTYRLKQVDTEGSTHHSEAITVERDVGTVQLLGAYPNPARHQATVRYALPDRRTVKVQLYDVLGRQVRTITRDRKEGRHEQTLDVSSLSSGVYFLRLRAGGETRTQKLTVVR
ncbi:hypothetical protein BSZ35_12685 [Salinibacter sp. 10B]|uniref:Ig-like domain-containing protein n=1 Tax=Salinibacter sp. 10B TaxID=1923971 RepID=UPI000D2E2A4B|nr:Ig-like domain-containing protein [Salinibacter sp. 10B]PQJ35344.1 hypothetical protein BSZ35_12685 [Salinibacter sp. 10B]